MKNKTKYIKLANGLKVLFYLTPGKNKKYAEISTKFGGNDTDFIVDGKKYTVPRGFAHLLEHSIVEKSYLGNAVTYMLDNYADFNAVTNRSKISVYFSTVIDFDKHFIELINIVNTFNPSDISDVYPAVCEEIKQSKISPYYEYNYSIVENIFGVNINDNLGKEEDILNITVNDLVKVYRLFFRPENQTIILRGDFNVESTIKIIEDLYKTYNFDNSNVKIVKPKLVKHFIKNNIFMEKEDIVDYTSYVFRTSFNKLNVTEKRKFDYYLAFVSNYIIGPKSKIYHEILEKKYSYNGLEFSCLYFNNQIFINIVAKSKYTSEILTLIKNAFKNIDLEDKFLIWKNKEVIAASVDLNESHFKSLVNNLDLYNKPIFDSVKFVKSLNYKEAISMINNVINLDDYSIYELRKKKD